ncbi:universal stress protein [Streptomyces sp. NPDC091280]|uniref:universal stress protein n=1 Tax=Streptomyces sp. NPDC091280 TaxID=3365984 RepID=UPI00381E62DF
MKRTTPAPTDPWTDKPANTAHGSVPRPGRVLLGLDARRPSGAAIDLAFADARTRGALLHAVHTWSLPPSAAEWPFGVPETDRATWEDQEVQFLADALRPWREKYPDVPVVEDVLLLPPARALVHHCGSAAQIVVSGEPGSDCGEVVRSLLREAVCPVTVVPCTGFLSAAESVAE